MKKEDYLWDKSGTDAEIEKLENALLEFRYRETPAPFVIPEQDFSRAEQPKRRIFNFSLAFSFASCAAFILILLGVWFYNANKTLEFAGNRVQTISPEITVDLPEKSDPVEPETEIKNPPVEKPTFTKAKFSTKKPILRKAKSAEKPDKIRTVKLTAEERYAYNRLMLALSITSSKLNLVKEKVAFNDTPNLSVKKETQEREN